MADAYITLVPPGRPVQQAPRGEEGKAFTRNGLAGQTNITQKLSRDCYAQTSN